MGMWQPLNMGWLKLNVFSTCLHGRAVGFTVPPGSFLDCRVPGDEQGSISQV